MRQAGRRPGLLGWLPQAAATEGLGAAARHLPAPYTCNLQPCVGAACRADRCLTGYPGAPRQVFSKCGIIKEGDEGRPRIKIYRDKATGMPKGDGLVTYLKVPSVRRARSVSAGPSGLCCGCASCQLSKIIHGLVKACCECGGPQRM